MSLANFRRGNGSDRSHLGLVVPILASVDAAPSGPADLPRALDDLSEEAGFLQTLLDRAPSGLESFGSEDNEPGSPPTGDATASDLDLDDEAVPETSGRLMTDQPLRADRATALMLSSPRASDIVPTLERTSPIGPAIHGTAPQNGSTEPRTESTLFSCGLGLGSALRGSRPRLAARPALVVAVALVGLAEAGWVGVRLANAPKLTFFPTTVKAANAAEVVASQSVTGTSGSAIRVSVRTTPAATQSRNSKEPGWVAITAPSLVEILEDGRVIGASWNGGVRLAPGRHRLRILNRAKAIDLEQTLDIPAGSTTSLVVDPPPAGR